MPNSTHTAEAMITTLTNGTRTWMRHLFKNGGRGKLSSMSVWNGSHAWGDEYYPGDTGFLVGRLWLLYLHTKEEEFADWAIRLTQTFVADIAHAPHTTQESGADIYYGLCWGNDITGDDRLKTAALNAARQQVQSLWSARNKCFYQRIAPKILSIDSTAFLLAQPWAARYDSDLQEMFHSHHRELLNRHLIRDTQHLVRDTLNVYQYADFDPKEAFIGIGSRRGWRSDSTWAQGQAWAMHAFTSAWEATSDSLFLEIALNLSDWWVDHSPPDFIPFYDFDDPERYKYPKDSCAAAIAANAMIRLAHHCPDRTSAYRPIISGILTTLQSNYLSVGGQLLHSTTGRPQINDRRPSRFPLGDILPFGNYYLVEAIYRLLHSEWEIFALQSKTSIPQ